MTVAEKKRLLLVLAGAIFAIALLMIVVLDNLLIGASQLAMASALVAVAFAQDRKSNG